jgi:hypothetical protein
MAFDSTRGVVVLFGGIRVDGSPLPAETWEYDGADWRRVSTATSPRARGLHAMAYDSSRGVVVLFGGTSGAGGGTEFGDTWEYDGTDWTAAEPASLPPAMWEVSLVYDSARGVAVLGGGMTGSVPVDTVWEFNGADWSRSPAEPPAFFTGGRMAYDSRRHVTVLFNWPFTWEYDGTSWSQTFSAVLTMGRADHAMAYDPARGVTVLMGGYARHFPAVPADAWEFDDTGWRQTAAPGIENGIAAHAMAYDSDRRVVAAVGRLATTIDDRIGYWEYDGTRWTGGRAGLNVPTDLGFAMAYDSDRGVMVVVPGIHAPAIPGTPTTLKPWENDGTGWRESPVPCPVPGRTGTATIYDSRRRVVVLFGGELVTGGYASDTWEYDGVSWTKREPLCSPSARSHHAMAYDTDRGIVLLFGGVGAGPAPGETWEYDGSTWTEIVTEVSPPPRWEPAMAYDSARRQVVLYGGGPPATGELLGDTWVYRLP